MSGHRVRVGIVTWNTAELVDRCLTSLGPALGQLDADVVVVDNASSDGSAERAASHAGVTVVRNVTNEGYAKALNRALSGTDAPVLVALNPDTEVPPGALEQLVDRLLAAPDVGLVAPRLVGSDGLDQHSCYRFPSLRLSLVVGALPRRALRGSLGRRFWLEGGADHRRSVDVDWAIGAVHVLRAAALAGRAPYDERWFMYAEDVELCWWLEQRGWRRRLEGDIAVAHVGNAAGARGWGARRERVHLGASLDWIARDRGRPYARAWALLNAAAMAVRSRRGGSARRHTAGWLARQALGDLGGPPSDRPQPGGPPPERAGA